MALSVGCSAFSHWQIAIKYTLCSEKTHFCFLA